MTECPECGVANWEIVGVEELDRCANCEYMPREPSHVPKSELRELIEQWKDKVILDTSKEIQQRNRTFCECADDLEELL